jgi:hypothetical protein
MEESAGREYEEASEKALQEGNQLPGNLKDI